MLVDKMKNEYFAGHPLIPKDLKNHYGEEKFANGWDMIDSELPTHFQFIRGGEMIVWYEGLRRRCVSVGGLGLTKRFTASHKSTCNNLTP